jgi:hypothetical protein
MDNNKFIRISYIQAKIRVPLAFRLRVSPLHQPAWQNLYYATTERMYLSLPMPDIEMTRLLDHVITLSAYFVSHFDLDMTIFI